MTLTMYKSPTATGVLAGTGAGDGRKGHSVPSPGTARVTRSRADDMLGPYPLVGGPAL